jgi:Protein of unknown function (DUF1153)
MKPVTRRLRFFAFARRRGTLCRPRAFSRINREKEVPVMAHDGRVFAKSVMGPDGLPLTLADLPPPGAARWVARRKAQVVAAVRGGLLSLEEAETRYALTVEEFLAWRDAVDRFGLSGLRVGRARDPHHMRN